ncbi:hypothetical protein PRZ48_007302 [Zasmidium cellare]|uniref:Geranylgeranyl pyrophosphate synthetase n=1 Tax=Zasmidium cellare TaxID=395010 RepID=A0ABR0EK29_ZASCE|nr:hypothetical protein PRZ48_007302 [Zasmidium cellare]
MASFSWLKDEKPTVVVPGMPPQWAPLDEPRKLEEDSGTYYRDINAAHYPLHPLEPAVRAVLAQSPDLALDEIDVFACGSTMGNLLRFAQKSDKPFQLVVETIGETVFLIRRENTLDEKMQGVVGYGHSFPQTYTKLDKSVKNAETHQRMINYDFAGFTCIVRYEADGFLPQDAGREVPKQGVQALPELDRLKLIPGGQAVPQESILEIKTRSSRKQLTLEQVLDGEIGRLWMRQVPNFVLAYHTNGVFNDVQVHDVRQQLDDWEKSHQEDVKLVSATLAKIVSLARQDPGRRFEACYSVPGVLEIRHVGGEFPRALPDDLVRIWASGALSDHSDEESDNAVGSDAEAGGELESDEEEEEDFTACSEACGYCGRCKYR